MKPLFATLFALAALVFSCGTAKADTLDNYVTVHGQTICHIINRDGISLTVFDNLAAAVQMDGGFGAYQAGEVIGMSVRDYCPWFYDPMLTLMKQETT